MRYFSRYLMIAVLAAVFIGTSSCVSMRGHKDVNSVCSRTVTVDYTKPIEELVKAGHYEYVDPNITAVKFPTTQNNIETIEIEFVQVGGPDDYMTGYDVLSRLEKACYRAATFRELLSYGAEYSEKLDFYALALGTVITNVIDGYMDMGKTPYVSVLYDWKDRRSFGVTYFEYGGTFTTGLYDCHTHFAVVKKSSGK